MQLIFDKTNNSQTFYISIHQKVAHLKAHQYSDITYHFIQKNYEENMKQDKNDSFTHNFEMKLRR